MYLFHHHLLHTTTPTPTCAHNRDTLTARAAAASYLAQKPPEFWKPKDWLDSRRLRALREWRALEAVVERLWRAGFEVYEAPDGEVVVRDPSTGEMGPVGMFLLV